MTDRKAYKKQWEENNSERRKEQNKQWRKDNSEYRKEYMKEYYLDNRERELKRSKLRQKDNPEYQREYKKQERKNYPERVRAMGRKHNSKRRRDLGFNPLNEWFEGSVGHHINKNDVVYMLEKLHRSIFHCLKTGLNMEKINKLAMANIGE